MDLIGQVPEPVVPRMLSVGHSKLVEVVFDWRSSPWGRETEPLDNKSGPGLIEGPWLIDRKGVPQ